MDAVPDPAGAFRAFVATHPEYEQTSALDALRQREFGRLDAQGQIYVDYTGSGLYASSQIERHQEALLGEFWAIRTRTVRLRASLLPKWRGAAGVSSTSSGRTPRNTRWCSRRTPAMP